MEKNAKIELVMSYDQWEERFKKNVRRWFRKKSMEALTFAMLPGLPLLLVVHWILMGY